MAIFLILILTFLVGVATGLLVQNARIRELAIRVRALEREGAKLPALSLALPSAQPSLQGRRVEVVVRQDHPLGPFEALLRDALAKEEAHVVETGGEIRIAGTLKGNGYADVYFDADLSAEAGGETLFKVWERPPHGDRPENLAREVVSRLKGELEKHERRGALRELGF